MPSRTRLNHIFPTILLLAFIWTTSLYGQSATIVFPPETTTNFVLNIPENQALKLHCNLPNWGCYMTKDGNIVSFGNSIYADRRLLTVQGPLTLELKATNVISAGTVTYQIVPSEGLVTKTFSSTVGMDISVPAGKILRILDSSNTSPTLSYELKNSEGAVSPQGSLLMDAQAHHAFFVVGPMTFTVKPGSGDEMRHLTYYFAQDVAQLPEGAIQVSGQSNITIEKSTDLSNWSTVGIVPAPSDAKAFYRLKAAQ